MAEQAGSLEVPLTALNEPIRLPEVHQFMSDLHKSLIKIPTDHNQTQSKSLPVCGSIAVTMKPLNGAPLMSTLIDLGLKENMSTLS